LAPALSCQGLSVKTKSAYTAQMLIDTDEGRLHQFGRMEGIVGTAGERFDTMPDEGKIVYLLRMTRICTLTIPEACA
jgi:hypothetical protein